MEIEHIQDLQDGFGSQTPLDYKFDSLIEIAEHFRIDDREHLKIDLRETLRDRLKDLIYEFETKLGKLKYILASVV